MRRKRLTNLALMHRTIMAGLQGFGLLPTLAPRAARRADPPLVDLSHSAALKIH